MAQRAHGYIRALMPGLAVMVLALASPRAQAELFTLAGTFVGTVQADPLPLGFTPPHPDSYYDGHAVVGSFEVALADPTFTTGGTDYAYFVDPAGELKLDYRIRGETFSYTAAPVILLQHASGASPSLTLLTDFVPKYSGASMTLTGAGLFDDLDATTIAFSGKPLFGTGFADAGAAMHFAVDVRHVNFTHTAAIPEPSTLVLMLGGAVALAWRTRRRRTAAFERSA